MIVHARYHLVDRLVSKYGTRVAKQALTWWLQQSQRVRDSIQDAERFIKSNEHIWKNNSDLS